MSGLLELRWKRAFEVLDKKRETPTLKVLEEGARYVPVSTRRMVWVRDESQCTFLHANGARCDEREQLDINVIVPFANGGRARAANLRLRCREHVIAAR